MSLILTLGLGTIQGGRSSYEDVLISDLKTKVQNAPQALWMFDEVTDLMTDASIFTRWQGVAALEPLVSLAKLKYLKRRFLNQNKKL